MQPEIDILLKLKGEYKELTGNEYKAPGAGSNKRDKKENKPPKEQNQQKKEKKEKKEPKQQQAAADEDKKKQTRLGVEALKEESLSDWYSQVIDEGFLL